MRDAKPKLPDRLIEAKVVYRDILSTSRTSFYRMLNSGEFPPGVRVRGRAWWPESQIQAWLRSRPIADLRKPAHRTNETHAEIAS